MSSTNKIKLNKITNEKRTELIATIDELQQYLNGNVTKAGLQAALGDLINKL